MTTPFSLTIDCAAPRTLAPFWCEALGYAPMDVDDDYAVLGPPNDEDKPVLFLQRVPEAKVAKNRMHFDLRCEDPVAEADRLCAVGASKVTEAQEMNGFVWLVLADPEGNEFCVCQERS